MASCLTHLGIAQTQCVPIYVTETAMPTITETRAVKMLPDGSTIIVGRAIDQAAGGRGYQGFVMRVSATGNTLWMRTATAWTMTSALSNEEFTGILPLSDGNLLVYGHTDFNAPGGKPWLKGLDLNGAHQGGTRILEVNGTSSTDRVRLKDLKQFPDGDIIGILNIGDSTATSDPVVFKMGLDGTVRWMKRFDNGGDESFTSIAFDGNTIYAAGYYTTTAKRGVIVQLNSSDGSLFTSKTIYHYDPINPYGFIMNEEVSGLEVYNNTISYGLLARHYDQSFGTNQVFFTQTDMQGNPRYVIDAGNIGGTMKRTVRRTADDGFMILNESTATFGPFVIKYNSYGMWDWSRALNEDYYRQTNRGYDLTPDGGLITAGYYNVLYPLPVTHLQIARLNAWGEGPACLSRVIQPSTDTVTLKEQLFSWPSVTMMAGSAPAEYTALQVFFPSAESKLCETTTCIDRTPLPPDCNKTYRIEYGGYERTRFRDAVTTPDGGRIIAGDLGADGTIVKTGVNGDLVWSKSFEEFYAQITIMRLLRMPDNTYLVFARTAKVINHGGWTFITIFRIDENGNILSSHDLEINGSYMSGEVVDVAPTFDGGFVLIAVKGWGSGGTDSYAIRFDPSLNVLWKKELHPGPLTPVLKSVACSRTAVFVGYDAYDQYNQNTFGLSKLDLATGNMIWGKRFATAQDNTERINRVLAINDTAYVFVNHYVPTGTFSSTQTVLMVRIDPQGNLTRALELNAGNFSLYFTYEHLDASPPTVTHTTDNDFILSQQVTTAGGTKELNMTRLTTDGNIIWSVGHPAMAGYYPFNIHQQANGFMLVGAALVPRDNDPYFSNGFMLKVDSVGRIVYPNAGACASVDRQGPTAVTVTPATATLVPYGTDGASELTSVALTTGHVQNKNEFMDATLYCYEPANCSQVTLAQRGNGCTVTDTLVYFLQNAANCGAVATWQYDPAFFKPGLIGSDTLKLIPLKTGTSAVKVDMEGHCFLETKNIQTSVLVSAANMHLAPDTIICEGGSLRISAGPGYASYRWNNNATDSFLVVNAAGKYYVDVTDNCGGIGTDTIIIARASGSFNMAAPAATKCNEEPVQLLAPGGFMNYQWSTRDGYHGQGLQVEVNPAVYTKYYLEAEKWPGCKVIDSFEVYVLRSPAITLPADATICRGDSITIDAGPSFTTYSWNTGAATQLLKIKEAGKYDITATYTNGCQSKDSFELRFHNDPVISLDKDPVLCKDATRILTPGQYNTYLWNDGSTGPSLEIAGTGTYWVTITDQHGCKASDTTTINTIAPLPANFLSNEMEICQFGELKLVPAVSFKEYEWSDHSTGATLTIDKAGMFWLQATDQNNCTGADTVRVIQKECLTGLYIPNAFTPNGDRNNDVLTPMLYGNAEYIHFTIYNRYGQKVFETNTMKKGWDGRINGQDVVAGTYVWQCRYKLAGLPEKAEKGILQLIR